MKKIFFSYNFKDKDIVSGCYSVLANQTGCELFFFDKMVLEGSWKKDVKKAIQECDYFVLFMGEEYGKTQEKEVEIFEKRYPDLGERFIAVELLTYDSNKFDLLPPSRNIVKLEKDAAKKPEVLSCMKELVERCIGLTFNFFDDLPSNPHLFDYEKTIIDFYITKEKLSKLKIEKKIDNIDELPDEEINEIFSQISAQSDDVPEITPKQKKEKIREKYNYLHNKLLGGCPPKWPTLDLKQEDLKTNEINEFGKFRSHSACVVAAALSKYHQDPNFCMKKSKFVFPEAGPREKLYFPKYSRNIPFRVGVLVSGGIAPGINAVIDGITQRHYKYFETEQNRTLEIWGLKNGFQGFGDFPESKYILKHKEDEANRSNLLVTSNHVNEGGSILGTSRYEALLSGEKRMETLGKIVEKLRSNHVRILYIIGGDGSMKAAHALSYIAKEKFETSNWNLSVIGIPKTMDNDILWVWQTFGFLSAVEKAREFIDHLAVEIKSNPRLGVVQLFGSDSGFVVSHAILASRTGICDVVLIPEVPFSMKILQETILRKFIE
ncbi:MAG: 6-phosphofructokinase, partial [Candidatus Aminicenantes bacterium]|nr:6-phosphofructokinase [Candidatus Aminicenantes bacterium]